MVVSRNGSKDGLGWATLRRQLVDVRSLVEPVGLCLGVLDANHLGEVGLARDTGEAGAPRRFRSVSFDGRHHPTRFSLPVRLA